MKRTSYGALRRWLVGVATLTILFGTLGAPVDATSYDASKIDAAFLQEVLANPKADFDVIVRATVDPAKNDQADRAGKATARAGGKAKHALGIVGGASATVRGEQLLNLTRDPDTDYIVKDQVFKAKFDLNDRGSLRTFDPVSGPAKVQTPGIAEIQAPAAWSQFGVTGRGIGVAVVDSGVYAHPDLAGRIAAAIDFTAALPTVSNLPLGDLGGHGTHVAGLVAGDGTASGGAYTGVAPNASIVDVRVIDANGNSNTSIILRALQWILNNRAAYNIRVVNLSLGAAPMGSYKSDVMATAAEVLTFANINVVVSAGNTGPGAATITSPAYDPYVITVGALDDNGTAGTADDLMTTFSSRGRTPFDNLSKPDVVAPGRRMVSLRAPGSTLDTLYPDREVSADPLQPAQYFRMSGTSMSAPVVAGTIALMLERNATLSARQVKNRLKTTATSLTFGTVLDRGAGMVNAYNAVASISTTKEYSESRVTDAFAKDMRRFIQGQPITWKDPTFHGGVDSHNITWENITWENITWDNITWENITWENFTWENITWENITWENVTWESYDSLATGALAGTGIGGWELVD